MYTRHMKKLPWLAAAGTEFTIKNPLGVSDLGGVIQMISDGLLRIAIPVAVVMIVWAGFNLLTAAGNPAKVKRGKDAFGYNAAEDEYCDMIEAGIIDPTKVTRTALQNAASIAGLMITTECVIADKPEEGKKVPGIAKGGKRGFTPRPGPTRVVAFIEEPRVVRATLAHRGAHPASYGLRCRRDA